PEFLEQFKTIKKKAMWQQEFFNLKQGTNTVDTYIAQFKKLQRKVDSDGHFPADFIVQLFIEGLRSEYAIPVQAATPEDLATAITQARHWEIEKAMATPEKDDVNDITKQLAQLYINS
ncbi:6324_t:CDS:1, partial [Cetraspora pellucida]